MTTAVVDRGGEEDGCDERTRTPHSIRRTLTKQMTAVKLLVILPSAGEHGGHENEIDHGVGSVCVRCLRENGARRRGMRTRVTWDGSRGCPYPVRRADGWAPRVHGAAMAVGDGRHALIDEQGKGTGCFWVGPALLPAGPSAHNTLLFSLYSILLNNCLRFAFN